MKILKIDLVILKLKKITKYNSIEPYQLIFHVSAL